MLIAIGSLGIGFAPLATAYESGRGIFAYALAVPASVVLASGNWYAWAKLADLIAARIQHLPEARQERLLGPLYAAAPIWAFAGIAVTQWLISALR
jgi:hypothetical protein